MMIIRIKGLPINTNKREDNRARSRGHQQGQIKPPRTERDKKRTKAKNLAKAPSVRQWSLDRGLRPTPRRARQTAHFFTKPTDADRRPNIAANAIAEDHQKSSDNAPTLSQRIPSTARKMTDQAKPWPKPGKATPSEPRHRRDRPLGAAAIQSHCGQDNHPMDHHQVPLFVFPWRSKTPRRLTMERINLHAIRDKQLHDDWMGRRKRQAPTCHIETGDLTQTGPARSGYPKKTGL